MDAGTLQGGVLGAGGALTIALFYLKDLKDQMARLQNKEDERVKSGDKMTAQLIEALTLNVKLMEEVKDVLEDVKMELQQKGGGGGQG